MPFLPRVDLGFTKYRIFFFLSTIATTVTTAMATTTTTTIVKATAMPATPVTSKSGDFDGKASPVVKTVSVYKAILTNTINYADFDGD